MLFCDGCDKGYHMNCHIPQVTEKPSGQCKMHSDTISSCVFMAYLIHGFVFISLTLLNAGLSLER